jgi:glutamate synthase (ferredoxin)
MTGGNVLILGEIGRNFGAGMSGGIAYLLKTPNFSEKNFNMEMINFEEIDSQDIDIIYSLLKNHYSNTASKLAEEMLSNWSSKKENFIKIMPIEYKAALEKLKEEKINQLIK